jgi:DNA polymerase V
MPTFALLDCNNFYASCEMVFNPKLKDKPLVILSNNDGCAVSRSNAAKALGIKMGAPWFQIQQQFNKGEVLALSSNYALYADMSNRVMSLIGGYTPNYEVYSIDEVFLSLDGFPPQSLTCYCAGLKNTVLRNTGLPVCVGIANTKTLSKLANHCAKKRPEYTGVCNFNDMPPAQLDSILQALPVNEVWGIGSRLSAKLNQIGVSTVLDLKRAHSRTLRDKFSVVMAKTIKELNGESCIDLEQAAPAKQNIASTRSFGIPVSDIESLKESVTLYTSRAAEKARFQKSYANSISVFIQTSPFARQPYYGNCQTVALPSPSNDTRLLVRTALWILKRLYRPNYVYQKAGVLLNDLVPGIGVQRDLFFDGTDATQAKNAKVILAMDLINLRYGRQTLKLGSEGFKAPWKMKQNLKSPGYTTDWAGLIKAI